MKPYALGYKLYGLIKDEHTDAVACIIKLTNQSFLMPENLEDAKYILCLVQKELEASSERFIKNRSIIFNALITSTLKDFAEAIEHFDVGKGKSPLIGLYKGLENMGIVDSKRNIKS